MLHSKRYGMTFQPPYSKILHRLVPMAQVLQMAGNTIQSPRCQGYRTFPPDLRLVCASRPSVSQRDTYQEAVSGTVHSFNRADICSYGDQLPRAQQVGQA